MPSWAYQRVSSTPGHSSKRGGAPSTAATQRASASAAGWRSSVPADGCSLQDLDGDLGAGARGRVVDRRRQPRELLVEVLLGVEAAVDGEPRRARHDVEVRAAARGAAHDEHRPARLLALQRIGGAAREQLVREVGERLGDLHHLLEGVHAEVRLADVRRRGPRTSTRSVIAPRLACQTTPPVGSAVSIATAPGVDHAGLAQVAGAGDAAGLLVADEVQDDPARRRAGRASRAAAAP